MVQLAWVALGWRLTWGRPWWAMDCQEISPDFLFRQYSFHCCGSLSSADSGSPYSPTFNGEVLRSLTAVVTKRRSCQIIGLEWPKPGIGVFQRTFSDFSTSQTVAVLAPGAMPVASGP